MARYGLSLVTAATTLPVTLEEARKQVEVGVETGVHDEFLERLIATATKYVETYTGRQLINATYDLYADVLPCGNRPLEVPISPLSSVTSIKYADPSTGTLTTWSSSNYIVSASREPGRITPAFGIVWPAFRYVPDAVVVRVVVGYGSTPASVPDPLRHAILLLVGDWFLNREDNAQGQTGTIPNGVRSILDQWRVGDEFTCYVRESEVDDG